MAHNSFFFAKICSSSGRRCVISAGLDENKENAHIAVCDGNAVWRGIVDGKSQPKVSEYFLPPIIVFG